jgi:sulfur-carrier protein
MAKVWIPALMRDLTGGRAVVEAPGKTLGEVLDALEQSFPGIKARVCDGERLDPALAIAVDGQLARLGLRQSVDEHSEVHFHAALGGG